MIDAELRGKLGRGYSRAHERAEDVLTSTVFGLLRYLDADRWLPPLAGALRPIGKQGPPSPWLAVQDMPTCGIELWPRHPVYGEPDVLLRIRDSSGHLRHLVIVEVKLYSPKSGSARQVAAEGSDEEEEDAYELADIEQDQLGKYWRFLCELVEGANREQPPGAPPVQASLVYLTAHPALPEEPLMISMATMEAIRKENGVAPRLAWISWSDLWKIMWDIRKADENLQAAQDIQRLLAHKGFKKFMGFNALADPELGPGRDPRFWRRGSWFRSGGAVPESEPRCWLGERLTPRPALDEE